MKRKAGIFALLICTAFTFFIPANAITFGREVTSASSAYPSVVSIWYSEYASEDPSFICTGTLIQPRVVLTAAHCVLSTGLYFVNYGADQLDDDSSLLEVDATWKNPRYSERQGVNDVGLLLLTEPIPGAEVTQLPSSATLVKVQASKSVKYEIVGWGKDQNSQRATYLKRTAVDDQTSFAKKIKAWAPWRNDVWFAVGKWNAKERVFSGACNGDSGGPLFASLAGSTYLAGVTSWGAEDCELGAPSVYVRLSYYVDLIKKTGIPQLFVNEVKQNRSLPSAISEPKIIGNAKTGATLTCDIGQWSTNTSSVSFSWSGSGVPYGFTGTSVVVSSNTSFSPKEYICTVRASNSNGIIERKLSLTQNPSPYSSTKPIISNMPTVAFNGNVAVSCNPGVFTYSNSVTNEWWIGENSFSTPTTKVATGNTFVLGQSGFAAWGGKYLYCLSSAQGDGGSSIVASYGSLIPSFQKPIIGSYPSIIGLISYTSPAIGTIASCSGWTWSNKVNSENVAWYVNTSSAFSGSTLIQNGSSIVLTQNLLESNKGKYLICAVTGINDGGVQISYTTHYLYYTPALTPTPAPTATPTPTPTATPSPAPAATPAPTQPTTSSVVAPSEPVITSVSPSSTSLSISWAAPTSNGGSPVTQYWAYVENSAGTTIASCSTTGALTCTVNGLTPSTTYKVIVSAWNSAGGVNRSSGGTNSPRTSATTSPAPKPSVSLSKTASASGNTFTLTVLNGKGPFIYEWSTSQGGRYVSSTNLTTSTFSLDSSLSNLNGFPTFREIVSNYNGPYNNTVSVFVNFVDKGSIGEGGGWFVVESNRLLIGP